MMNKIKAGQFDVGLNWEPEMDRLMKDIFKRIDEERRARNLNQKDIATYLGYTESGFSNIKKGGNLKVPDLEKIAEFLNIPLEELLPMPNILDISKMSFLDLIKHIVREECANYFKLMKKGE